MKASLKESGYHQRIITTPDLEVIGGHMRIKALQELGVTDVEILVPNRPLTEAEFKRILIQDNVAFGTFDIDILATDFEFDKLIEWGLPEDMLTGARAPLGDEAAEETPALEVQAISKTGDLWMCGPHRVMCGDAANEMNVAVLLGDSKPNLMITDPPYGVEYDPEFRNGIKRADGSIVSARAVGKVINDDRADWREAFELFPGNIVYAWCASMCSDVAITALEAAGFQRRAQIIWAKSNLVIGRGDYHWQHEPCWYAVRKGEKGDWHGDRKQTTLWQIDKPQKSETGHSTQKPIECMRRPMENNTAPGAYIYDPFLGSGTSVIAAEQIGRICLGMEIAPQYIDLIVRRWQTFTGKTATLAADGRSFAQIETERSDTHETSDDVTNKKAQTNH